MSPRPAEGVTERPTEHLLNCGGYRWDSPCICGLPERQQLWDARRTEQEMHRAWRKRAEDAEREHAALLSEVERLRAEREEAEIDCQEAESDRKRLSDQTGRLNEEIATLRAERERYEKDASRLDWLDGFLKGEPYWNGVESVSKGIVVKQQPFDTGSGTLASAPTLREAIDRARSALSGDSPNKVTR